MQTLRSVKCSEAPKAHIRATAWVASALVLSLSVSVHAQDSGDAQVPAAAPVQGPSPEAPDEVPDEADSVPPDTEEEPSPVAEEESPAPVEVAPAPVPPSHALSYALWSVSGASFLVGTVFGVLALQAKKDYDAAPSYDGADTAHDRAIVADVGLGLGVILAVTGTVFYFGDDDDTEKTAKLAPRKRSLADLRVAPFAHRGASGGTLSVRF